MIKREPTTDLSKEQEKVVNYLYGQCLKRDASMRRVEPKLLRKLLIEKLEKAAEA